LGKPAVKAWMHGEFLLIDNGKMSKSLGNTYTIDDLKAKGFEPLAYRYFCLNGHYRNKLNFTWESIQAAQVAYNRFLDGALTHKNGTEDVEEEVLASFKKDFDEAVNDDLNIPKALGIAWNAVKYPKKSKKLFDLLVKFDEIMGLNIKDVKEKQEPAEALDPEIEDLVNQRQQARKDKNWKLADEIRDKLKEIGIVLEDTPQGVRWKRV